MLKLPLHRLPEWLRPRHAAPAAAIPAAATVEVPMPAGLAARLRAIPAAALGCDDVERLYAATLSAARGAAAEPAVGRHLESCARCRATYAALATSFRLLPVPLPARLRFRLAALRHKASRAQFRPLPVWIADLRFAAAVCTLATAVVLPALGGPRALLENAGHWGRQAALWQQTRERAGLQVWSQLAGRFETTYSKGKENLASYGRMWGRLVDESARVFVPQDLTDQLDRYLSSEGDSHGEPSTNV